MGRGGRAGPAGLSPEPKLWPRKTGSVRSRLPARLVSRGGAEAPRKLWQLLVVACFGGVLVAAEMGHRTHQQMPGMTWLPSKAAMRRPRPKAGTWQISSAIVAAPRLRGTLDLPSPSLAHQSNPRGHRRRRCRIRHLQRRWKSHCATPCTNRRSDRQPAMRAQKIRRRQAPCRQPRPEAIPRRSTSSQTVVTLSGTMTDPGELHAYLESLAPQPAVCQGGAQLDCQPRVRTRRRLDSAPAGRPSRVWRPGRARARHALGDHAALESGPAEG